MKLFSKYIFAWCLSRLSSSFVNLLCLQVTLLFLWLLVFQMLSTSDVSIRFPVPVPACLIIFLQEVVEYKFTTIFNHSDAHKNQASQKWGNRLHRPREGDALWLEMSLLRAWVGSEFSWKGFPPRCGGGAYIRGCGLCFRHSSARYTRAGTKTL